MPNIPLIEIIVIAMIFGGTFFWISIKNPIMAVSFFVVFCITRVDQFLPSLGPLSPSILIELIIVCSWFINYLTGRVSFKFVFPETYIIIGFWLLCLLSAIFVSHNLYDTKDVSLFKTPILYLFLVFAIMNFVQTREDIELFAKVIVLCGLILCFLSLSRYFFFGGSWIENADPMVMGEYAYYRSNMKGIQPDAMAITLAFIIPFMLYFVLKEGSTKFKTLCTGGIFLSTLTIILTFSRTGFLALSLAGFMILQKLKKARYWFAILAFFIILVVAAPKALWYRIGSTFDKSMVESSENRIYLYATAIKMIKDEPVIGVGFGNYPRLLQEYGPPGFFAVPSVPHNVYLEILSETGPLGLIIFLTFVALLYFTLRRMNRLIKTPANNFTLPDVLIIGLFIYLLAAGTSPMLYSVELYIVTGIALGMKRIMGYEESVELVDNESLIVA
ncbi:O-antigen ligase family protein [candidate division KSB1 bacterium]|nr:O-antigen ligase family protein [candidate division KSB1 bacterium]